MHRSPEYLALQGLPLDYPQTGAFDAAWIERVHPDDREEVRVALDAVIARGGAFERAYRIIRPDTGEVRWILNRGRVDLDADGKPSRLLSAQSDITEHRVAESKLRELNERLEERALTRAQELANESNRRAAAEAASLQAAEQFRLLVQGVVDYALCMLDPEGNVSTWNVGAERIKGYRAEEIVGKHFSKFYTEEDRASGEPQKALHTARTTGRFEKTAWRVRKDGSRFMANIIIDAIHDNEGRLIGFAKITRDVTDQREAQRQLEETREALVHAQKMEMVGQLTGGLAHDFNNMLAGIIGALNLMQRRIAAGRFDEVDRYIEAALTSANRAASLTSRLLAFGRRASLDIKPVDVAAAISSMEILLTRSIGENIRLNLDLGPAVAMTDANQLESAVLNLAVNARDAMPDGGVLDIATRAENGFVTVIVTDTGVGMPADVLAKAFDPFFTTKPIGQGTGLGLSMVHGFAKQSGGDVRIESEPGGGTRVVLLLPRAQEAAGPQPRVAASGAMAGAGETVLVVEDDPQVRMLVLELLKDLGYAALEASDAREALALLEQQHVDLMVSDVGLPGLNGRQLAEMARARSPKLKILFMTGYAEHAQVRSSFLGADMDMIAKPFEIDDLAKKVRAMVAAT
jgi:PAS domain S-box-containing protein